MTRFSPLLFILLSACSAALLQPTSAGVGQAAPASAPSARHSQAEALLLRGGPGALAVARAAALDLTNQLGRHDPATLEAYVVLGEAHASQTQFDSARAWFHRVERGTGPELIDLRARAQVDIALVDAATGREGASRRVVDALRVSRSGGAGTVLTRIRPEVLIEDIRDHDHAARISAVIARDRPSAWLEDVASFSTSSRDFSRAIDLLSTGIIVRRAQFGSVHPWVAASLTELATTYYAAGRKREAVAALDEAMRIRRRILPAVSSASRGHAEALARQLEGEAGRLVVWARETGNASLLSVAVARIAEQKPWLWDARNRRNPTRSNGPAMFEDNGERLRRLGYLLLSRPDDFVNPGYAEWIDRAAESLAPPPAFDTPLQDSAGARGIPKGARVLRYACVPGADRCYLEVIPGGSQAIDVGAASSIDARVQSLRQALQSGNLRDFQAEAHGLEQQVLEPALRLLTSADTLLLIVPDGMLDLVPFAALLDDSGNFLLSRYTVAYLTALSDLEREFLPGPAEREDVVLVTNPNYGAARSDGSDATRGGQPTYDWKPLAGTEQEGAYLALRFQASRALSDTAATEAAVKRVVAPRLFHFGTHGFYWDTLAVRDVPRDPMQRSGLVLSGANVLYSGPGEDGILTAAEAMSLNLRGTELVVVSACDSGLGDIRTGDGIYGLRRAILEAGAKGEVMTLWEIEDARSADLIVSFYRHLLAGEPIPSALRNAQREIARESSPFVWAAFLSIGSPAGLSPELMKLVRREE